MLPNDLDNPETKAIGLDANGLVGKTIAEVRALVDRDDCALVLATEEVPASLPREVMRKEPDAYEGKPSLGWLYQTEDGEWRGWYAYIVDDDFVRRVGDPMTEIVLAQVYTARARQTPGVRVRPIVSLHFDLAGVCRYASDTQPQFDLVRVQAQERSSAVRQAPAAKTRVATSPDAELTAAAALLELQPPSEAIVLEDWEPKDARTGRFGWVNECDLRALMLMNGRMDCRATIGRGEAEASWWLVAHEGQVVWPHIRLDAAGLRVVFQSPAGEPGPAFDAHPGCSSIELVDANGSRFVGAIVVVQRTSPVVPTASNPGMFLLGDAMDGAPAQAGVIARLLPSEEKMEIASPSGTRTFDVVGVRRGERSRRLLVAVRFDQPL
jgi:hypothetical protein